MTDYLALAKDQGSQTDATSSNPYLEIVKEGDEAQRKRARTVIETALKDDPELAAERKRLSDTTGLPPEIVRRNVEQLRLKEQAKAINLVQIAQESPVLYRQLVDPTFTTTSIDDLDTLKNLEKSVVKGIRYAVSADDKGGLVHDVLGLGADVLMGGTAGVGEMYFNAVGTGYDLMGLTRWARDARAQANASKAARDSWGFKPESVTGQALKSGAQSAGVNLALMPLGLSRTTFASAQQAGSVVAGIQAAGVGFDAYLQAREKGLTQGDSLKFAIPQAGFEYLFERIPAGKLFGDIAANTGLMKTLGKQAISEGWTEQLTTLAQDFNEWMNLNPGKTTAEFLAERPGAAYQTFIATLMGVGIQTTTMHSANKIVERMTAQPLQFEQDLLQQQMKLAAQSALRTRSPEQFREHMRKVIENNPDKPSAVYVDGEVLNQLAPDVLAQLPQSVREAIPGAFETNSTVAIPMADLLTVAPGTPLEQIINDNARIRPDSPTRLEVQQADEWVRTEADRVLQQAADQVAWKQSSDEVRATILDQLNAAGRFSPEVNAAYASLQSAFFSTMAARIGISPREMYDRFSLKVTGSQQATGNLDQGGNLPIDTPEFRNWFGDSKVVDAEGKPLVVYHGSPDLRFMREDATFKSMKERIGFGRAEGSFWFTPSLATAKTYADPRRAFDYQSAEEGIVSAFIKLENPLVIDAAGQNWRDAQKRGKTSDVIAAARDAGHDGVVIRNVKDDYNNDKNTRSTDTYVVFDSTQIKSATGNRGTFDPNDPNILHQSAQQPVAQLTVDENGMPQIAAPGVFIGYGQPAERIEFIPTDESGEQLLNLAITGDNQFTVLGFVEATFKDGKPTASYDIEIDKAARGNGAGARAVKALLDTSAGGTLHISNIVQSAQGFWEKLGIPVQNVEEGAAYDGELTTEDFLASPAGQNTGGTGGSAGASQAARGSEAGREGGQELNQSANDLVVTHNLTADNLLHAVKMGGIPVPSLAITKKDHPLTGFGEITLIGSKDLADPKGYASTKVFGADIYSPRYPSVSYEFTPNMRKRAEAQLKDGMVATDTRYIEWGEVERDGARELGNTPAFLWQFLAERGVTPDVRRVQAEPLAPELMPFLENGKDRFDLLKDDAFVAAAWGMRRDMLLMRNEGNVAETDAEIAQEKIRVAERGRFAYAGELAAKIDAYRSSLRDNGKVDRNATLYSLRKQVLDGDLSEQLDTAAKEFIAGIGPNERIFQGYTNAGNRKYIPHTLENVVKILKKELRGGESFNYGVGSLRAKFAPQFKSVEQIRKAKGRLVSNAQMEKVKKEIDAEFWDVARAIDPDLSGDTAIAIMEDAAKMGVQRAAKNYGYEVDDDTATRVAEFLTRLRELPTEYFEAKILREVDLAEFSGAVVPEGVDQKVLDALRARGVTDVRTYKKGDETDRAAKIGEFQNLFFQNTASPRGTFNPQALLISLTDRADLSTFLHESGHFFLEVMADVASQPGAPAQIVDDMNTLLKWFGIKGDEQVGGADSGAPLDQPAYHGTPYRGIEKFSTDKIGTGEGAQAYGWGLYFAGKREIAEFYREKLSGGSEQAPRRFFKGREFEPGTGGYFAARLVETSTLAKARKDVASWVNDADTWSDARKVDKGEQETLRVWREALDILNSAGKKSDFTKKAAQGQLYEVDIPEDSEMLLWDKPLSEQPEGVRKALGEAGFYVDDKQLAEFDDALLAALEGDGSTDLPKQPVNLSGESIYKRLTGQRGGDKAASEALAALGIKGIKYLDGTSRVDGEGTYNYVIFSGDDVAIKDQFYQDGPAPEAPPIQPKRTPLETWRAMTLDQKRPHHERLAESFEQYLLEGKAPSQELQPLFRKFRSWLVSVYKSLTEFMRGRNLKVSDEVRRVFDRMLATDEQIAQAEEAAGMLPDFDATNEAIEKLQARSLRDLKWTVNARSKALKALQKEAAGLRKAVEAEVRAEVEAQPPFKAQSDIAKLRRENKRKATDIELAIVAEANGFGSADQMLAAIAEAGKREDVIEGMTDQRMLENFGELATPQALEEAANDAVHNEARARALATELKAQQDAMNPREDTGRTASNGRAITVNALSRAAKEFAANLTARRKIRDLRNAAWEHQSAESRAAKAWHDATTKGDTKAAVQAKRDQLLNNYAAKSLHEAQDEVKQALEFFKRVTKGNDEKLVQRGRDPDVVNAMRAILGAYDVAPRLENGANEYMATVKRNDPAMYAALEPSVNAALNNAKPLNEMRMEELRGLVEELRAMWDLAKRSRKMEVDGNLMDIADAADALVARMDEIGIPATVPGEAAAITTREELGIKLQFAKAILSRVEQWAERRDGKFGGPFLRYVFQPIKDAADRYRTAKVDYHGRLTALVQNVAPALPQGAIAAPEIGYTFGNARDSGMAELMHAILHTGNDSNKRKLLLGRRWATENPDGTLDTSKWDALVSRLINEGKLTKAHYDFAQGVWDLLEETKPLAQATHRQVFGRYFAEVTANEVVTPFGTYRGGYIPAQTDTRLVKDAALRELAEGENSTLAYAFPAAPSGFTKSRVDYNQPLLLDLRVLSQHLDKVLLFSHMQGAVTDVRRLLTDKRVSYALNRIDPGAYEGMLLPWLNRAARQSVGDPVTGDRKLSRFLVAARSRAGMALMMGNVSNTVQQLTGFSSAAVKVGGGDLLRATAAFAASPAEMKRAVAEMSEYMRNRMGNEVAAMNDEVEKILVNPGMYELSQAWTRRHAYFMQSALDNTMGPIVWTAAYNQAIADKHSERDAVRFADGVIRQTQGSTLPEDVSRFETGKPIARFFTQFVGYFNMLANTNATAMVQVADEMGLRKGAGKLLYVALVGMLLPIWIAEAIAIAFKGGPEDKDKDGYLDDWLAAVFGFGTLKGFAAQIPIVGQGAQLVVNRFNHNPADDKFSLSPAVSLIESAVGAPKSVYDAIVADGNKQKAVRDVAAAATMVTGLPFYAAARPVGYAAGMADGKIEPTDKIDLVRGLITGTASPESKHK